MNRKADLAVGIFLIIGILALTYLSVSFGKVTLFNDHRYEVIATFPNVTGLKVNTSVEMLGIPIGSVKSIVLKDYRAKVTFLIDNQIDLPEDSVAAIRTKGLLGENYVSLTPGGLPTLLSKDGTGEIMETRAPIVLEELIGKAMFGSTDKENKDAF